VAEAAPMEVISWSEDRAVNPELERLITLQELDLKIREIEQEIANVPNEKAKIESQFQTFAADYLDKQTRLNTAKREHRQLELDLKENEEKLEKYKQDLMRVRNEREYSGALREIDATKKKISGLETEILNRMELIDNLEKEIAVLTPEVETKRREFDVLIEEFSRKMETFKTEGQHLRQQRKVLVGSIRPDLLAKYERLAGMRDRLALAEVRDGSCTACFMTIRPQAYSDVRKGDEILTCDNCSRILYYKPTLQAEEMTGTG
jgi:hypothetical protein